MGDDAELLDDDELNIEEPVKYNPTPAPDTGSQDAEVPAP